MEVVIPLKVDLKAASQSGKAGEVGEGVEAGEEDAELGEQCTALREGIPSFPAE